MKIDQNRNDIVEIHYKSDSLTPLLNHLKDDSSDISSHLSLFLGHYFPHKEEALKMLSKEIGLEVNTIDLHEIVTKSEKETYKNLDNIFEKYSGSESILYFKNGDKLCGAYTGYTHSRVKYASPQERYFLTLAKQFNGIIVMDISEYSAADKTIRRVAHSIVRFDLPDSLLKRFIWHLKNYSLHGYDIKSKRPESYGEVPGNF